MKIGCARGYESSSMLTKLRRKDNPVATPDRPTYVFQADAARAKNRKRSAAERDASRRQLGAEWDAMPEDHELKIRYRRDFEERHMEKKLARLIAPGLDGAEDSEQKEAFGRCGATAFGVGCRECPVAPEALDEWRRQQPKTGLNPLAQSAIESGQLRHIRQK